MNKNLIKIIQGDITEREVDAIVNAANNSLLGGGGVDGAIHRAAGPELKDACKPLGGCDTGDAKITKGFNLKAKYVIHAVGPVWNGGDNDEEKLLGSAYQRSMEVAKENDVKSIAFPSISTGVYRFPFDKATKIAIKTILDSLEKNTSVKEVTLVAFSENDYKRMKKIYEEM